MDEKKNLPENILDIKKLDLWYGENHALKNVNMEIKRNAITAFIGPSGCGKSTFLKTLNRMNDLVPGVRIEGQVLLDGVDIYDPKVDTSMLRKKIGMDPCCAVSAYAPVTSVHRMSIRVPHSAPASCGIRYPACKYITCSYGFHIS